MTKDFHSRDLLTKISLIEKVQSQEITKIVELCELDPASFFRFKRLDGADFSNQDLTGYDFTGSSLTGCNWKNSILSKAIFDARQLEENSIQGALRQRNKKRTTLSIGGVLGRFEKPHMADVVCIDIGTSKVRAATRTLGMFYEEPCVVGILKENGKMKSMISGAEINEALRKSQDVELLYPLKGSEIIDDKLLKNIILDIINLHGDGNFWRQFSRKSILISVPAGATQLQMRARKDSLNHAGFDRVFLIPEILAAAIGAGLPIHEPSGSAVVHLGAGHIAYAIFSLNDIVYSRSIPFGGIKLNESIIRFFKDTHNVIIDERAANNILARGSVVESEVESDNEAFMVKGVSSLKNTEIEVKVHQNDMAEALAEDISVIIDNIKDGLEASPPELAADIVDKGILLTGGLANMTGLDTVILYRTGLHVYAADDSEKCVIEGLLEIADAGNYQHFKS